MTPPSFSRFRGHAAVPKRPRTGVLRKPLQPKVFVPADSGTGLPRPIDIPPDIFPFPAADDLVPGITFQNDPVSVAGVVYMPETDVEPSLQNGHSFDRARAEGDTAFVTEHNEPSFADVHLQSKPESVTQIVPQLTHQRHPQRHMLQEPTFQQQTGATLQPHVRRRASGVLPQSCRAPWLLYEDRLLTILTRRYPENWELISAHFSDRSAIQVQRRWHDHLKLSRKWSPEESATIRKLQLHHPNDWTHISASLRSRTSASIRYHWFYDICNDPEYS